MGRRVAEAVAAPPPLLLRPLPPAVDEWLAGVREALLAEVVAQNGAQSEQKLAEARARLHALSTSADTVGVSFAGAALHHAYVDSKAALRAALTYRLLDAASRQHAAVARLLQQPQLCVASLGGGPACELAGLACLLRRARRSARAAGSAVLPEPAQATTFDLERSWRRYLPRLQALLSPTLRLSFELCDVRLGAPAAAQGAEEAGQDAWPEGAAADPAAANRRLFELAPSVQLWLASFVVHETAAAAGAGGFACFRALLRAAAGGAARLPAGCLFVFLDVRSYSRHVMEAIHAAMLDELQKEDGWGGLRLRRLELAAEEGGQPLTAEVMLLHLGMSAPVDAGTDVQPPELTADAAG